MATGDAREGFFRGGRRDHPRRVSSSEVESKEVSPGLVESEKARAIVGEMDGNSSFFNSEEVGESGRGRGSEAAGGGGSGTGRPAAATGTAARGVEAQDAPVRGGSSSTNASVNDDGPLQVPSTSICLCSTRGRKGVQLYNSGRPFPGPCSLLCAGLRPAEARS